ncbi:MAG: VOC family protein [Acidimicrobiales bacterium]|nr:VOC family protein [Acidimicrobiales bacterium]
MSVHHIQLWVPDLDRATRSWGWLLSQLGYEPVRRWSTGRLWRDDTTGVVVEQSPDMVPGMLHSRLRPGLNHIAFRVPADVEMRVLLDEAPAHGWTELGDHPGHPVHGDVTIAFLEDKDGFEVELIGAGHPGD